MVNKKEVTLLLSSNGMVIKLSPTRGMGILSVEGDGVRMGWDSPGQ